MQIRRKTNIFNIYKKDSTGKDILSIPQFITFSNYGESMTGNHLSVNTKMFPSGFICFNIPKLNNVSYTESFYKSYLVAHYENKLAFLRDYITDPDVKNFELDSLRPLDYLIRSIKDFDSTASITHIGDIVEQNYNGIYSDMLLTINVQENEYSYKIINNIDTPIPSVKYHTYVGETNNKLYGWYNVEKESDNISYIYNGPYKQIFDSTNIRLDDSSNYYIGNQYSNIQITDITSNSKTSTVSNPLTFNVIVPLFNIYNIDENTSNSNNGITSYENNNNIDLTICNNKDYIPYGVWFSGINNYVTLNRNINVDTSDIVQPSWSLVLSSQFSAFPYSSKYSTNAISNTILNSTKYIDAYHNTFASVLTEQSNLIDLLYKQNKDIVDIRSELETLKRKIK